ncbi:MAG: hypothetical protein V3W11_01480, partial [bacterium]
RTWEYSADLGVGFQGEVANGLVEHHLTLTNGAGYKSPDGPLSGKAAALRLSVFPLASNEDFKGLSINAYARVNNLGEKVDPTGVDNKNPEMVYGAALGLTHKFVNFGAGQFTRTMGEGVNKVDGNVMTVYATGHFRASEGMTIHPLARYDIYKPDKDNADADRTLLVGGVGFKFFDDKLALIPNYQTDTYKVADALTGEVEDKSHDYVYLHCEWNWK